jgi:hypothetical protein
LEVDEFDEAFEDLDLQNEDIDNLERIAIAVDKARKVCVKGHSVSAIKHMLKRTQAEAMYNHIIKYLTQSL